MVVAGLAMRKDVWLILTEPLLLAEGALDEPGHLVVLLLAVQIHMAFRPGCAS
jgi:hypothetical protein